VQGLGPSRHEHVVHDANDGESCVDGASASDGVAEYTLTFDNRSMMCELVAAMSVMGIVYLFELEMKL
jgi:hypothetical protein